VLWPTQRIEQFELLVSKDEYSPRKMIWDFRTGDQVPASYTVKLKGSIHVGGFVVDPEGNPIAEATVSLGRFWRGGEEMKNQGEEVTFPSQKHTSGVDGRWAARNVPPELLERISISGSHSNFIDARVSLDGKSEVESELRAGTYKLQLRRGLVVRGRVINEQQQPIADADVWAGRKYSNERKKTKTDELGKFTFQNVNTGRVDFSASAEGYSPDYKTYDTSAATEDVVIQLARGSIVRGVVQDESNQPIEGVRVVLEGSPPEPSYDRFEFSTTTDSEGKFEWRSAPNSPMPFYFGKTGYQQKRGVRLKPAEDNVVTLRLNRKVQGLVLDADTEKPVTRFTAANGRSYGENQFYPDSQATKEFKSEQGLFTLELHEENENAVQVTASGYAEQTQTLPAAENGEVKVVFKLKPSATLAGTVVTPDGQPVPDAKVALVDGNPGGRTVQFGKGQLRSQSSRTKLIASDASGRFEIPSPPEVGTVVAANGVGYGSATVAEIKASGILMLQSMGRIEGILLQGATPAAGQEVLMSSQTSGLYFEFETMKQTTDGQGNFAFENVPAGTFSIVRLIKTSPRSWRHSHSTPVTIVAGQTTQIVLGGTDATLHGQVRFETVPTESDYHLSAELSSPRPSVPDGLTPDERKAYMSSTEWKDQISDRKNYAAVVNPDGSVMLDSIAPGQYTLKVAAQKSDGEDFRSQPIATGEITVTVPPGANPAAPIQIGEVLLKAAKK